MEFSRASFCTFVILKYELNIIQIFQRKSGEATTVHSVVRGVLLYKSTSRANVSLFICCSMCIIFVAKCAHILFSVLFITYAALFLPFTKDFFAARVCLLLSKHSLKCRSNSRDRFEFVSLFVRFGVVFYPHFLFKHFRAGITTAIYLNTRSTFYVCVHCTNQRTNILDINSVQKTSFCPSLSFRISRVFSTDTLTHTHTSHNTRSLHQNRVSSLHYKIFSVSYSTCAICIQIDSYSIHPTLLHPHTL